MIQLGDKARDTITGFTGICVAKTEWLHGCTRVTLQPDKIGKDGKIPESHTFDEPQLEPVKPKFFKRGRTDTGGPRPEPEVHKDTPR
jgi:hypothetical protein